MIAWLYFKENNRQRSDSAKGCGQLPYVSLVCAEQRRPVGFLLMWSPLARGGFSGRKRGRICESGRNKMKGQSDQTSPSLAPLGSPAVHG